MKCLRCKVDSKLCHCIFIFSEVTYGLVLNVDDDNDDQCQGIDGEAGEAIEFAVRNDTIGGPWIPLQLHNIQRTASMSVIRGYNVSEIIQPRDDFNATQHTVYICGDILQTSEVLFRWMGTASLGINERSNSDVWALANANAILINDTEIIDLFSDGFGCVNSQLCSLK